jgi:hypothetical protein
VVEARTFEPSVVHVLAPVGAIDAVVAAASGAAVVMVAPGELLLIGDVDRNRVATAAGAKDSAKDRAKEPTSLVLDVSDGWTAWTLSGPDAREAFARLSELALPAEGSVQGEVVRVPVKVLVEPDLLTLLIPAMWGDYLGERIRTDCAALGVQELSS